ncbi:hypothetical protein NRB_21560 [Novosphingobium sp. 11B]
MAVQGLAVRAQFYLPEAAVEQAGAEAVLQLGDRVAHRARRQAEFVGGLTEGALAGGGFEDAERL